MFSSTLFSLALAGFAAAAPFDDGTRHELFEHYKNVTHKGHIQAADCNALVQGLNIDDCNYMNSIGMAGMGDNVFGNNGYIWIGEDGPNTFTFNNNQDAPVTLVLWDFPAGDYEASFMNVRRGKVTYSLPNRGDKVTVSLNNGISGGWSALYNHQTTLSQYGQIYNTWGEFTTGDSATVDVSRLVNMGGNNLSINVPSGCVADMERCSFHCKNGNECGESGTYDLLACTPDVNPNGSTGTWDGINPEGGCQGWSNGGHLDVWFN